MSRPAILYSFRRCPYAMRARIALHTAGIELEHREILLKNKPPAMLEASPKGTVPVLVLPDGKVIDESWDVVQWALTQNDPENWLGEDRCWLDATQPLVERCETEFKPALDRYKYADRHPEPAEQYRQQGMIFLQHLESLLQTRTFILADHPTVADIAIMPFVRQFAHVDKPWFVTAGVPHVRHWLDGWLESPVFRAIMQKQVLWKFEVA